MKHIVNNSNGGMTHTAAFRITESQRHEFTALVKSVPGADTASMYREVFARGLQSMRAFSEAHELLTREEVAAELAHEGEVEHDLTK